MNINGTAVLVSIRPKWVELIERGEKTIELRKSRPKIEPPFLCYIYCSKGRYGDIVATKSWKVLDECRGKVVCEFVCDEIHEIKKSEFSASFYSASSWDEEAKKLFKEACLSPVQAWDYAVGGKKTLYGWHITQLKMYDAPIRLGSKGSGGDGKILTPGCLGYIYAPPQSWCYAGVHIAED